jgi:DnaJ-class molecular chaperone
MATSTKDFYATLEVPRSATAAEIKKAYKRQALQFHPDKNPGDQRAVCEAKFKLIARAYEVLGNDETRKRYDAGGMKAVDAAAAAAASSAAPSSRQSDAASTASSRRPEPSRRERSEWQTGPHVSDGMAYRSDHPLPLDGQTCAVVLVRVVFDEAEDH